MPLRNLTVMLVAAVVSALCYNESNQNRYAQTMSEAINTISQKYVRDVDSRKLFEAGISGMLQKLDPYSSYISPEDKKQFESEIRQQFGGIGIEVGIRDNKLTVLSPMPGTPAYEVGLLAGDVILAVDDVTTAQTEMNELVKRIKGKPGTTVRLRIQHIGDTEPIDVSIVRAIIKVESIRGDLRNPAGDWRFVLEQDPRIGYIRLAKFAEKTSKELRKTLVSLNGDIEGLILDLRGNPGGLLSSAIEICDLFTDKGQAIVSIKGRGEKLEYAHSARKKRFVSPNLAIVVLVDNNSASASEILAACLQDHQIATIVGRRTWGKGTVQNVIDIESGRSAIRLTTATYWRPSGKNIHRHEDDDESTEWGVSPLPENNIELSDEDFQRVLRQRRERDVLPAQGSGQDLTTVDDPQLDRAIDVIRQKLKSPQESA